MQKQRLENQKKESFIIRVVETKIKICRSARNKKCVFKTTQQSCKFYQGKINNTKYNYFFMYKKFLFQKMLNK